MIRSNTCSGRSVKVSDVQSRSPCKLRKGHDAEHAVFIEVQSALDYICHPSNQTARTATASAGSSREMSRGVATKSCLRCTDS